MCLADYHAILIGMKYPVSMPATRRGALSWLGIAATAPFLSACGSGEARAGTFRVHYTEAEWRRRLSPEAFHILREEGTERPFSSPLNKEKRKGTFHCAGCGSPLFSSRTKYDSGTGWPSFWKPLSLAIGTRKDFKLVYMRIEVHCATCGGHLGHVFDDGPKPTGLRYCINGAAMRFRSA